MGALENLTAHLLFANAAPGMFVIREGRGSLEHSQAWQDAGGSGEGGGLLPVAVEAVEALKSPDEDSHLPRAGNEGGSAFKGADISLPGGAGERSREMPGLRRAELIRIFEALDKNENSEVSMAEFIKGLRQSEELAHKLGMPVVSHQEHESRTVFQLAYGDMDADSSKSISFDEFWSYFRERGVAVDDEAEEGDAQGAQEESHATQKSQ